MNTTELSPAEAIEDYLASKHDVVDSTVDNHRYRLEHFLHWSEESGIGTMSELSGYDIEQYKNWRLGNESPECNLVTLKNHLHTFRQFLRWCESVDAVTEGLAEKVIIPSVGPDEQARDVAITHERACEIIDYLSRYHYASNAHIVFHLSYHTGARRLGIHSLDVDDWHPKERYLSFRNRPEQGTRLKLGDDGERNVTISDGELAQAIDDYIANTRPDVEDDHGRHPLIASHQGRLHYQTITKLAYKVTRPCYYRAVPKDAIPTTVRPPSTRATPSARRTSLTTPPVARRLPITSSRTCPRRSSPSAPASAPKCWIGTTTPARSRSDGRIGSSTSVIYSR